MMKLHTNFQFNIYKHKNKKSGKVFAEMEKKKKEKEKKRNHAKIIYIPSFEGGDIINLRVFYLFHFEK